MSDEPQLSVLERLSEDECYLYALLTDPSGLDQAEFAWVDFERDDMCWRAWAYQWRWFRNRSALQIDQCLATGTLVLTQRGQVAIEDVVVGDQVLTHKNRWRPVTYTWDRGEQETVVLKGHGHPGMVTTPDHRFWLDGGWRTPEVGDYWSSPTVFPVAEVPRLPERTYVPGRPSNVPTDVAAPEFLWLYGLYLAEGSCSSSFGRGGVANRVTYSVHTSEVADVEAMLDKVGLRYNTQVVRGEECRNIVINSRQLAAWFVEHGGKGAHGKSLAAWVLGLDDQRRQAILDGAMFGDGYKLRGEYTTVSWALAVGMKLLIQSVGHAATLRRCRGYNSTINGRLVKGSDQFVVAIVRQRGDHHDRVRWGSSFIQAPIKYKNPGRRVRCYDLEVADDHSFVADGIVVSNCGRSVGKSLSIKMRAFAFPLLHPGQEMVITAPELVHLHPITGLVEHVITETRLTNELLPKGRNRGITHRPFQMDFLNGSRIIGRIPQRDGRGVKGIHPIWLEQDEASDFPQPGWIELIETLKRGHEGAVWRAHGVTRGVRDFFYKFTQPESGWTVHQYSAMHRPTWTDEERREKVEQYGSKNSPDYRRNILGLHGDATNPLFVLSRLMQCVDGDESSDYNTSEYQYLRINAEMLTDYDNDILSLLDFPMSHKKHETIWIGMDVGYTNHPSEILVFAQVPANKTIQKSGKAWKTKAPTLKLINRIHLERIGHGDQVAAILHLITFYKPKAFSMDKTGLGLPLFQDLQERAAKIPEMQSFVEAIKGYNFSAKILVDFDSTKEYDEYRGDIIKDQGIERNVLEYASDKLRELVDDEEIILPWDRDLIGEFQGQTWCVPLGTTIFTKRGWLSWDQIVPGDETLTLSVGNDGAPRSAWGPIQAVNVFPAVDRDMVELSGQVHHSRSTADHRWLVKPYGQAKYAEWRTSDELCGDHRYAMPVASDRDDLPGERKYDDDFVELVAWFYTEGHFMPNGRLGLSQSRSANPHNTNRIEALLVRMLGPGGFNQPRGPKFKWNWSCVSGKESANRLGAPAENYHILHRELCQRVREVVLEPDKRIDPAFLVALTSDQLDLFIDVSMRADGCQFIRCRPEPRTSTQVKTFQQKELARIESFEMACVLRGYGVHTRVLGNTYQTTVLQRRFVHSTSLKRERVVTRESVWCPVTGNGTWLARHEGAVFFTGNTYDKSGMDMYGRRKLYSQGQFHALDAARMAVLGMVQQPIEEFTKREKFQPVSPMFISFFRRVEAWLEWWRVRPHSVRIP